jgi:hypothetical protein
MRASEFILLEYDRKVTLSNIKTKSDLIRRIASGHQEDVQYLLGVLSHDLEIHADKKHPERLSDLSVSYPDNVARTPLPPINLTYGRGLSGVNYDLDLLSNLILKMRFENVIDKDVNDEKNKKLHKYIPWVLREYIRGNIERLEDISGVDEILKLYEMSKKRRGFPANARDIVKLDYPTLRRIVRSFNPNDPEGYAQNMGRYKVLYGDIDVSTDEYGVITSSKPKSDVVIIQPLDESAAIYFGRHFGGFAEWCTAYVPPQTNRFDYFNDQGPMYIIVPREPKHENEKYQIHDKSMQFKDEQDDDVSVGWLLKERFPQILDEMFEIEPGLSSNVAFIDEKILEDIMDIIVQHVTRRINKSIPDESENIARVLNKFHKLLNSITIYDILEDKYEPASDVTDIPKALIELSIKNYDGHRTYMFYETVDWLRRIINNIIILHDSELVYNKNKITGYIKLGIVGDYYIGVRKE